MTFPRGEKQEAALTAFLHGRAIYVSLAALFEFVFTKVTCTQRLTPMHGNSLAAVC